MNMQISNNNYRPTLLIYGNIIVYDTRTDTFGSLILIINTLYYTWYNLVLNLFELTFFIL